MSHWLVPQEGAEERTEWGRRAVPPYPGAMANDVELGSERYSREWVADSMSDQGDPWTYLLVRRTVRTIPDGNGGTWVHTSAWQVVEEAKP